MKEKDQRMSRRTDKRCCSRHSVHEELRANVVRDDLSSTRNDVASEEVLRVRLHRDVQGENDWDNYPIEGAVPRVFEAVRVGESHVQQEGEEEDRVLPQQDERGHRVERACSR